jgi:hypothetical protein
MPNYEPGQRVFAITDISEGPSGDSPGGDFCRFGDELIIKQVHKPGGTFRLDVHHEGREGSFGVKANEISYMRHFDSNYERFYVNGIRLA